MRKARRGGILLVVAFALGIAGASFGQDASVGQGILVAVDLETGLLTLQGGDQILVDARTEIVDGYGERLRLEEVPVSTPDESREVAVRWEASRQASPPRATRLQVLLERPE
jgi:hypothetical protein